jgi:MraZ protein
MWGEYPHSSDDKGRVVVPLDFRTALGDEFFATRGPDGCVWLLPANTWDLISGRIQENLFDPAAAALQRMFSATMSVKLDGQFRLAIPKHLRAWAGIGEPDNVVIAGQGAKVEVWQRNAWQDQTGSRFSSEEVYGHFEALSGKAPAAVVEC